MLDLRRNWIWDVMEIDWKDISMTLNGNEINLPSSVEIYLSEINSEQESSLENDCCSSM